MGWISYIRKWNCDRYKIIQLRHQLAHLDAQFEIMKKTSKHKRGSDESEKEYWDHFNNVDLTQSALDEIESRRAIERARYWGVPIPGRPPEWTQENDNWDWSTVHYTHYLSEEGKALLRRQCYAEMEMAYKPWATWLAVGASFLSLIISLVKS